MVDRGRANRWRGLVLLAVVSCLGAGRAGADTDGCPTWLPDFSRECHRQARPEGTAMPMSFPYLFEDPYITSGLNFVGIWHEFPNGSVFQGGQLGVLALQIRLALTEDLAFIATKDGIGFLDADNPLIPDDTGFFNLSVGLKYKLLEWSGEVAGDDHGAILSPSLRYEIPLGQRAVYQGHDSGVFIPALSGAYRINRFHGIFAVGGQAPVDTAKGSSSFFYNAHVDYSFPLGNEWVPYLVPFMEYNGIHWIDSGGGKRKVSTTTMGAIPIGAVPGFEGVDVANLGNLMVSGQDYYTMAWGVRLLFAHGLSLGAAYERPLTNQKEITRQRVTTMVTWEF